MSELIVSFLETACFTIKQDNLTGQNSGMYIVRLSAQTLFRDDSFEKNLKEAKKGKINIETH